MQALKTVSMKAISLILTLIGVSYYSSAQLQIDGSYLNMSRPTGGPVATGDILQLRSVIAVPNGTTLTNLYYTDVCPAGTSYVSGSLQVLTNEGVVNAGIPTTGSYTDVASDDAGQEVAATGAININMGTGAGKPAATGGTVQGGVTTPIFYTNATILMAAYQVKVTAATGSTIALAGAFHYTIGTTTTLGSVPASTLLVSTPYTCTSTGASNYVLDETGGTFGSGNTQNRSGGSTDVTGFTLETISTTEPVDGDYSLVNNTSGNGTSVKVFGDWDIIGDHSGTSTGAGNPAAPGGSTGGYLLAINATYAPATVFTTTIGGLTAHSTYTISLWAYNLCPVCGNNPQTGVATTTPGVLPNIGITVNGNGVYSSGNIAYTGQWVQKSFTFNIGATTTAILAIKNNAPGGGGNDWALDDIKLTQCLVVLPLELTGFTAQPDRGAVQLNWGTATEDGVGTFAVQRSNDGVNFVSVGEVTGTGRVNGNSYTYTDEGPNLPNQVWYRLQVTDARGVVSYSSIVVVNLDAAAAGITARLSPNPSAPGMGVTLLVSAPVAQPAHISVWNLAGARFYQQDATLSAGDNSIAIQPRTTLPAGLYIVKVVLTSGAICTKWVIFAP